MQNTNSALLETILPALSAGESVEITPRGTSMLPFLKEGRDRLLLMSPRYHPAKWGDIVLYQRENGMLVVHRICRIRKGSFYLVGDNQTTLEGPLPCEQIIAIVIGIHRYDRYISTHQPLYFLASHSWLLLRPMRPWISKPLGMIYRFLQRFFSNKAR